MVKPTVLPWLLALLLAAALAPKGTVAQSGQYTLDSGGPNTESNAQYYGQSVAVAPTSTSGTYIMAVGSPYTQLGSGGSATTGVVYMYVCVETATPIATYATEIDATSKDNLGYSLGMVQSADNGADYILFIGAPYLATQDALHGNVYTYSCTYSSSSPISSSMSCNEIMSFHSIDRSVLKNGDHFGFAISVDQTPHTISGTSYYTAIIGRPAVSPSYVYSMECSTSGCTSFVPLAFSVSSTVTIGNAVAISGYLYALASSNQLYVGFCRGSGACSTPAAITSAYASAIAVAVFCVNGGSSATSASGLVVAATSTTVGFVQCDTANSSICDLFITLPNPGLDNFGFSLSGSSTSGNTLAVGATTYDSSEGEVYLFACSTSSCATSPYATLTPPSAGKEAFGTSAAYYGDFLVVGAPDLTDGGTADGGYVYVYRCSSNATYGWCQCTFPHLQPLTCDACQTGWTSLSSNCSTCASGYYGSSCTACTCGDGVCADGSSGNGQCSCNGNYTQSTPANPQSPCNICQPNFNLTTGCTTCLTGWTDGCSTCSPDYYGSSCAACTCGNGTCGDGSSGDGSCTCSYGFAQSDPSDIQSPCDVCAQNFDPSAACSTCLPGFNGTTCMECLPGYYGSSCTACTCDNGICADGISNSGQCACDINYAQSNTSDPQSNCDICINHYSLSSGCTACVGDNWDLLQNCSACSIGFLGEFCLMCNSSAPYVQDGDCVSACSSTFPYLFNNSACVSSCPDNAPYYLDMACVPACVDPLPYLDGVVCNSTCPVMIENSTCVDECSSNYYTNDPFCLPCSSTCETCIDSPGTCTSCSLTSAFPLQQGSTCVSTCSAPTPFISDSTCVSTCPSSTPLVLVGICVDSCNATMPFTNGTMCVASCPVYINGTNCVSACDNLIQDDFCVDSCDAANPYTDGLNCVASCPVYTNITNCVSACDDLVLDGFCVDSCNATNPYTDGLNCVAACPVYTNGTNCVSACDDLVLDGFCVDSCNAINPYTDGEDCVESCPVFYNNMTCVSTCPDLRLDVYCVTVCNETFPYIDSGVCVDACEEHQYPDADANNTCEPCFAECDTCFGPTENDCLSCSLPAFLNVTTCVTCPVGYFGDSDLGFCYPCDDPNCDICSSLDENSCTACSNQGVWYLKQGDCVDVCPTDGFFLNGIDCLPCNDTCLSCNGPAADQCTSCNVTLLTWNATCVDAVDCPLASFPDYDHGTCSACNSDCGSCSMSASNCTSCSDPAKFLYNSVCFPYDGSTSIYYYAPALYDSVNTVVLELYDTSPPPSNAKRDSSLPYSLVYELTFSQCAQSPAYSVDIPFSELTSGMALGFNIRIEYLNLTEYDGPDCSSPADSLYTGLSLGSATNGLISALGPNQTAAVCNSSLVPQFDFVVNNIVVVCNPTQCSGYSDASTHSIWATSPVGGATVSGTCAAGYAGNPAQVCSIDGWVGFSGRCLPCSANCTACSLAASSNTTLCTLCAAGFNLSATTHTCSFSSGGGGQGSGPSAGNLGDMVLPAFSIYILLGVCGGLGVIFAIIFLASNYHYAYAGKSVFRWLYLASALRIMLLFEGSFDVVSDAFFILLAWNTAGAGMYATFMLAFGVAPYALNVLVSLSLLLFKKDDNRVLWAIVLVFTLLCGDVLQSIALVLSFYALVNQEVLTAQSIGEHTNITIFGERRGAILPICFYILMCIVKDLSHMLIQVFFLGYLDDDSDTVKWTLAASAVTAAARLFTLLLPLLNDKMAGEDDPVLAHKAEVELEPVSPVELKSANYSPYEKASNYRPPVPVGDASNSDGVYLHSSNAGYGRKSAAYGQSSAAYGQSSAAYGQSSAAYGQSSAAYGQSNAAYGQSNAGYGQSNAGYGQSSAGYGSSRKAGFDIDEVW